MKPKILLVDDQAANLRVMQDALKVFDADFITAHSGEEALSQVLHHELALILMDIKLPGMGGIEAASLIREDQDSQHIPIILVTTYDESERLMFRGYEAGAADYLYKPIQRGVLRSKVKVFLQLHEQRVRLQEHSAALARSNRDFRDFAHAASHDLKAPIRAIKGYGELLSESDNERLSDEGKELLQEILTGTTRMDRLVTSLLAYADVDAKSPEFAQVELAEVIAEVKSDLIPLIDQIGAVIEVAPLVCVEGNDALLYQLFQNLIGNSLKYCRPDVPCKIDIASQIDTSGQWLQILVTDNGIGFDPAQADTIFEPFRRLVGMSEYEGSGVGMATAKKIVQCHGGTIRATGSPGKGATFVITLPIQQAHRDDLATPPELSRLVWVADESLNEQEWSKPVGSSSFPALSDRPCALVVDDDPTDRRHAASVLSVQFETLTAASAEAALRCLIEQPVDFVLTDFNMPGENGAWLLEQVRQRHPDIPRMLTSGTQPTKLASYLASGLVHAFAQKPVQLEAATDCLANARDLEARIAAKTDHDDQSRKKRGRQGHSVFECNTNES